MVKLRLTRTGKRGEPHYRIIAIHARTKREGRALEYLGYYNPRTKPSTVTLKDERIKYWLSQGAQPTNIVRSLLVKNNLLEPDKVKKVYKTKPGRKKTERAKQRKEKGMEKKEDKKKKGEKIEKKIEKKAKIKQPKPIEPKEKVQPEKKSETKQGNKSEKEKDMKKETKTKSSDTKKDEVKKKK